MTSGRGGERAIKTAGSGPVDSEPNPQRGEFKKMVSPSSRRRAVKHIIGEGLGSAAQACRAIGLARSSLYRASQASEGEESKPMKHGQEKSDLFIIALKPTNKPGRLGAELVEPRERTEGNMGEQHTYRTLRRIKRVPEARLCTRNCSWDSSLTTRGGSPVRESRPPGSVRGASSNGCPYRDGSEISSWMRGRTLVSQAKSCATRQPVSRCQSSHKTSCDRILERFLMTNDPRERLSVLYFPFRARTPKALRGKASRASRHSGAFGQ